MEENLNNLRKIETEVKKLKELINQTSKLLSDQNLEIQKLTIQTRNLEANLLLKELKICDLECKNLEYKTQLDLFKMVNFNTVSYTHLTLPTIPQV